MSRPRSAYNFFMQEKRAEIIQQNPNLKALDVMKEVSRLWKNISKEEKEKYIKMSDDDCERLRANNNRDQQKPTTTGFGQKKKRFNLILNHDELKIKKIPIKATLQKIPIKATLQKIQIKKPKPLFHKSEDQKVHTFFSHRKNETKSFNKIQV